MKNHVILSFVLSFFFYFSSQAQCGGCSVTIPAQDLTGSIDCSSSDGCITIDKKQACVCFSFIPVDDQNENAYTGFCVGSNSTNNSFSSSSCWASQEWSCTSNVSIYDTSCNEIYQSSNEFPNGLTCSNPDMVAGNTYYMCVTFDVSCDGDVFCYGQSCPGGNCESTMPVELVNFTGKPSITGNQINWETSSEINNNYFTILRSTDAKNWEKLEQIEGAGNSSTITKYSYTDHLLSSEKTYYKLKQTDLDGTSTTSKVISIENSTINKKLISAPYPNPTNGNFSFNVLKDVEQMKLEIFNRLGITVYSKSFTNVHKNRKEINIENNLPSGVYNIQISTTDTIENYKLIID